MLVYIAAPLGDPDPAVRAWHRERANLLAALAFARLFVPVCVRTYAESAIGPDTDPSARDRGLALSVNAVEQVARTGGALWTLLWDDCSRSAGCKAELARFLEHSRPYLGLGYTWANWRTMATLHAPHLLPEFDRLAVRP